MYNKLKNQEENIMDFFDDAVSKAKEVFGVAKRKTEDVVTTQKQKFDIASMENKLEKDYAMLGKLYFKAIGNDEIEDENVKSIVDAIKEKNQKIAEIKEELSAAKNKRICPKCMAEIDANAVFCSACGERVIIDE